MHECLNFKIIMISQYKTLVNIANFELLLQIKQRVMQFLQLTGTFCEEWVYILKYYQPILLNHCLLIMVQQPNDYYVDTIRKL